MPPNGTTATHDSAPTAPELEEPPYEEGDYYSDEEYEHTYGANGDYQQGYGHAPVRGGSSKKPRRKKKAPSGPPPLSYSQHSAPRHSPAPNHAVSSGISTTRSGPKKDRIWNTSSVEERERIRDFWLSLGEDERKSLVKIEKEAVLRKMKEQQKHSCSCTVCGRKRTAIEEELEVLYDAYYEELEQYAHHQQDIEEEGESEYDSDISSEGEYSSGEPSLPPPEPTDFLRFGSSLQVKGGILTVADDLLKNDGKKFIEMMEQLAERRMQREEEAQFHQAHPNMQHPQGTMTEEQRMEEGRRMFQIFAARMFEQRVLQAYREKEREAKSKSEKDRTRKEDQAAPAPAKKTSQPVAVALPPQLLKQNSSTGMPSPHVTPAVPKAPTPNRQRQTSQQNSHGSSPKTPHATLGTSKSTSPTSQAYNQTLPRSILTKPNLPQMPTIHGQPTSPMPHLGPPPGMQGPPGLNMGNMPPGLNGFANQGSMMPGLMGPRSNMPPFFPPVAPQSFRGFPPPGMHTPGALPLNRGFPMDGPPGFPAPPGFSTPMPSPFPLGMPTHSRQGSGSFERVSSIESPLAAPQSQPIQRPAPIQRPSSIKPSDENVDELASHLGSKALLDDDEDDIPELPERRQSVQQHGSVRAPSFGFADIPGSQYGSFGGPGGGSIWGTPPLQGFSSGGNWGNSPTSNMFGSPPFPMGNPRVHERSGTEQRIVWLRRTICAVCKSLALSSDPEGYIDASEVHRQVDASRNAMEPVVSMDEIREACDILDVAQTNGGGTLEYREHNGRLTHIKFSDAAPAPPSLGEIGSPVPSQSVLAGGGFGRFPGLGPQGF
ncbi:Stress response protein NST1 [Pyrenophora tritici-repentis]|uniref:Stress response protein NST1 n=1 Tax=Pyrenophora tritici-repentis TaxID=45151 RepID=A0A2W1FRZ8_9PLEO|nr:Stress response protein NST1 [Pyrenophora tritici-repentis]KAF7566308.1 NST1 multi-domain protein [Pyrenophora tritici-repentis]KAI0583786.1 Stress response protein NST1 [Pyrenophora tritici-repentis]PZD27553.1 NST1 multi-domain protein [Pyrenophora tritici-repentis]PZD38401.1 NST1 multi-domain protein [Pyrenophora tritici-repentis]